MKTIKSLIISFILTGTIIVEFGNLVDIAAEQHKQFHMEVRSNANANRI